MSKLDPVDAHYYTKMRISEENDEESNKNVSLEDLRAQWEAENAKSGEKVVKTPIYVDIEAKMDDFIDSNRWNKPTKPPVSVPNPNKAFKAKRPSAKVHKDLDIDSIIDRIEKGEIEKMKRKLR